MTIFLTLDYELFLSVPGEDINQSLLQPTLRFSNLLEKYRARAVYFADAGYLFALQRQADQFKKIKTDLEHISTQLQMLVRMGNDIGLHIHPHWEDSYFNGDVWKMNLHRYKLADFSAKEAAAIFRKYHSVLKEITKADIISYRAGGWCLEPFHYIREVMTECGIYIDSTVFYGGYMKNRTHSFDFRNYPQKDSWWFNDEPSLEDESGRFLELPITSCQLPPLHYWKILVDKVFGSENPPKKGRGVSSSFTDSAGKLLFKSDQAVSMDSFKAAELLPSYKMHKKKGSHFFCVIGHPKCFTESTFLYLEEFLFHVMKEGNMISTFSEACPKPRDLTMFIRNS